MKHLKGFDGRSERQRGLSLVELIIALALGVVLTLGVTQIFLGSNQTYRLTDGLAVLQENARFAIGSLQHEGRMAGHYGCLIGSPVNNLNTLSPAYSENVYDVGSVSAMGWEATDTGLGDAFTISSLIPAGSAWTNGTGDSLPSDIDGNIVPGTDVLVINSGERVNTKLTNSPNNGESLNTVGASDVKSGRIVLVVAGDCSGADLFQNTDEGDTALTKDEGIGAPGNISNSSDNFSNTYDKNATVYEYVSTAYYIDKIGDSEPALFRNRLDAGDPFGPVELVSGVESMQVLYGVASGGGASADSYVPASDVTNWGNVVSIRVALLFRSNDNIADEAAGNTYNLIGTQITTQSDRRARLVGLSTISIRNRLE